MSLLAGISDCLVDDQDTELVVTSDDTVTLDVDDKITTDTDEVLQVSEERLVRDVLAGTYLRS